MFFFYLNLNRSIGSIGVEKSGFLSRLSKHLLIFTNKVVYTCVYAVKDIFLLLYWMEIIHFY